VNLEQIHCEACGANDPVIPRAVQIMRTIALALIWKPYRLRGEDVRFLRKYQGTTVAQFSTLLAVDEATLSRWEENHAPVEDQSDRLIRLITIGLSGSGLKKDIEAVIRAFPEIEAEPKKIGIRIDPETMAYEFMPEEAH
jgi:DNA-binding transcriptional regulator YiaG